MANSPYSLVIVKSAERDMGRLETALFGRLSARIALLAASPRPVGSRKLRGSEGYRLRVGDYRVLYEVDDRSRRVKVYAVRHRREAYR